MMKMMVRRKSGVVSSSCNASKQKLKKEKRVMSLVLWIQLKVGQSEQERGEGGRNRGRRG